MTSSYIDYFCELAVVMSLLFTHSIMKKIPAQKGLLVGEMYIYKVQEFVGKCATELWDITNIYYLWKVSRYNELRPLLIVLFFMFSQDNNVYIPNVVTLTLAICCIYNNSIVNQSAASKVGKHSLHLSIQSSTEISFPIFFFPLSN